MPWHLDPNLTTQPVGLRTAAYIHATPNLPESDGERLDEWEDEGGGLSPADLLREALADEQATVKPPALDSVHFPLDPPTPSPLSGEAAPNEHRPIDPSLVHSQPLSDKTGIDLPPTTSRASAGTRGASAQVQPPVKGVHRRAAWDLTDNRPSCKEFLSFSSIREASEIADDDFESKLAKRDPGDPKMGWFLGGFHKKSIWGGGDDLIPVIVQQHKTTGQHEVFFGSAGDAHPYIPHHPDWREALRTYIPAGGVATPNELEEGKDYLGNYGPMIQRAWVRKQESNAAWAAMSQEERTAIMRKKMHDQGGHNKRPQEQCPDCVAEGRLGSSHFAAKDFLNHGDAEFGKGAILNDGSVHTWPTHPDEPFHDEGLEANGRDLEDAAYLFQTFRDERGTTFDRRDAMLVGPSNTQRELMYHDILKRRGLIPDHEDGWDEMVADEPKPVQPPVPAPTIPPRVPRAKPTPAGQTSLFGSHKDAYSGWGSLQGLQKIAININELDPGDQPLFQDTHQRAFLYEPRAQTLHLGWPGSHHFQLFKALNHEVTGQPQSKYYQGWTATYAGQPVAYLDGPMEHSITHGSILNALQNHLGMPFGMGGRIAGDFTQDQLERMQEEGVYHVAPAEDRARILQHGLQPSNPHQNPRWEYQLAELDQPPGLYVTDTDTKALRWGEPPPVDYDEHLHPDAEPTANPMWDVWHIPPDQLQDPPTRDPVVDAWYLQHPVKPTLFTPGEEHWLWPHEQEDMNAEESTYWDQDEMMGWNERKRRGIGWPDRIIGKTAGGFSHGDLFLCNFCGSDQMTEPKQFKGHWTQTCTNCGRTRYVDPTHPFLRSLRKQTPYPEMLGELNQGRPMNVFGGWKLGMQLFHYPNLPNDYPEKQVPFVYSPQEVHVGPPGGYHDDIMFEMGLGDTDWSEHPYQNRGWVHEDGRIEFDKPKSVLEGTVTTALEKHLNKKLKFASWDLEKISAKPVVWNRGLLGPEGQVHLWPEDEATHNQMLDALQVPWRDQRHWTHFTVADNTIGPYYLTDAEAEAITKAKPHITVKGYPRGAKTAAFEVHYQQTPDDEEGLFHPESRVPFVLDAKNRRIFVGRPGGTHGAIDGEFKTRSWQPREGDEFYAGEVRKGQAWVYNKPHIKYDEEKQAALTGILQHTLGIPAAMKDWHIGGWKLAMPFNDYGEWKPPVPQEPTGQQFMYHVSYPHQRQGILQNGLDPTRAMNGGWDLEHYQDESEQQGGWETPDELAQQDNKVWLHPKVEGAWQYMEDPNGGDIWEVNMHGIPTETPGDDWGAHTTHYAIPRERMRAIHLAPDRTSSWKPPAVKIGKETPGQLKRRWEAMGGLQHSEEIHKFPTGESIYHLKTYGDVGRVGLAQVNCWKGRAGYMNPERPITPPDDPYAMTYHSVHDQDGVPQASFYILNREGAIEDIFGARNKPPDPHYLGLVQQFAKTHGLGIKETDYDHPIYQGYEEGGPADVKIPPEMMKSAAAPQRGDKFRMWDMQQPYPDEEDQTPYATRNHGKEVVYDRPDMGHPGTHFVIDPQGSHLWVTNKNLGISPTYYHWAPTTERARIQQHGLQAADPHLNNPHIIERPAGSWVHMVHHPSDVPEGFGAHFMQPGDIWEINGEGIENPKNDPDFQKGLIWPENIAPERLRLHTPYEQKPEIADSPDLWKSLGELYDRGDAMQNAQFEMADNFVEAVPKKRLPLMRFRGNSTPFEPNQDWYYHYAPTTERARIQQHGLMPSNPNISPNWEGQALDPQPPGVYLFRNPKGYQMFEQPMDRWRVPREQIAEMYRDQVMNKAPNMPGSDDYDPSMDAWSDIDVGAYYVPHEIPLPELDEPYEMSDRAQPFWDMAKYMRGGK